MTAKKTAEEKEHSLEAAAQALAEDLKSRAGFGPVWDSVDEETKKGIVGRWAEILKEHLG